MVSSYSLHIFSSHSDFRSREKIVQENREKYYKKRYKNCEDKSREKKLFKKKKKS